MLPQDLMQNDEVREQAQEEEWSDGSMKNLGHHNFAVFLYLPRLVLRILNFLSYEKGSATQQKKLGRL